MSSISSWDSDSITTLFSSLNTSSTTGVSLADYASIRNGSYSKLMKAYYANTDNEYIGSIASSADSSATLAKVQSSAGELSSAVNTLTASGSSSVFKQDDEGNYDTDKIYEAVKDFADSYNNVIKAADSSDTSSITNNTISMISTSSVNAKLLASVGISIDSDYRLSVDEDTFKKADMSTVKSLFNGTGSYAYQVGMKASVINSSAQIEAAKANTYTGTGSYSSTYDVGTLFSSET